MIIPLVDVWLLSSHGRESDADSTTVNSFQRILCIGCWFPAASNAAPPVSYPPIALASAETVVQGVTGLPLTSESKNTLDGIANGLLSENASHRGFGLLSLSSYPALIRAIVRQFKTCHVLWEKTCTFQSLPVAQAKTKRTVLLVKA